MRIPVLLLSCALIAGACAADSSGELNAPTTLPLISETAPPATQEVETEVTTTVTYPEYNPLQLPSQSEIDALVAAFPTTTTTTAAPKATQPKSTAPKAPVTAKPATSSGGACCGVDIATSYFGKLGFYGPDQVLATAPAAAPTTAPGTSPLTGLPGANPANPPVVVKIDNAKAARPQTGLNNADIIFEEEVEWGGTRFAAVYHSWQGPVGPVRSGRSTDISILLSLGTPSLAYSGANPLFDQLLLAQPGVKNFSAARSSGYWRTKSKRAPSNLMTNTTSFIGAGSAPPAQFAYRPAGVGTEAGTVAGAVKVNYPAYAVEWAWDGANYLRFQAGQEFNTDTGRVSAANVVVVEVERVATGIWDSAGGASPEFVYAGQGRAWVYTDARRIEGTWTRPTLRSPAVLTAADGSVIELTPGRTWVEIIGPGYHAS